MASDDEDSPKTIAVGCLAIILLIPVTILLKGYIITQLWAWFLVPMGVSAISLAHAYGLTIIVGLFTSHGQIADHSTGKDRSVASSVAMIVVFGIILPLMAWFGGWICHMFM